jgi:hypothetical protein
MKALILLVSLISLARDYWYEYRTDEKVAHAVVVLAVLGVILAILW